MLKQSRRRQNAENGLKGRFPSCPMQRNVRNACTWKTPKIAMHAKNRIDSILCIVFFACMHCVFWFFDCVIGHSRSLKMVSFKSLGTVFLFAFYSNYGRISSHFGDIRCQRMASPWNLGFRSFKIIENGAVRQTMYEFLLVRHCNYSSILYHLRVI